MKHWRAVTMTWLEQVYLPCILPSKKRYCGFMYESPSQVRGNLLVAMAWRLTVEPHCR